MAFYTHLYNLMADNFFLEETDYPEKATILPRVATKL